MIYVPYTRIDPFIRRALQEYNQHDDEQDCADVNYVEMVNDDSYWQLLSKAWEKGEAFAIIEHDVLPWPGALKEIQDCPALWCAYTYKINLGYGITHAFGCCKFSADLIRQLPHAWSNMEDRHWSKLDSQFCYYALRAGYIPHPHRPAVIHADWDR